MKYKVDFRWIIAVVIILAILGIVGAVTQSCLYLEVTGETTQILKKLGCDE